MSILGYDTKVVEICRLTNGWEVEIYNPPPPAVEKKQEQAAKDAPCCAPTPYVSPWVTLAFSTLEEALTFIKGKEKDLKPRNFNSEYAASFASTVKSMTTTKEKAK